MKRQQETSTEMNQNNMAAPATLTVLLFIGIASSVDPLHCTTVPFKLTVAVNVRVEVMSARVVPLTSVGLAVFVRMATKLKSSHRTAATLLQSNRLLVSVLVN